MLTEQHINVARLLARKYHKNQKYGDKPYFYHLQSVVNVVNTLFPAPSELNTKLQIIGYLHDIIEDTNIPHELIVKHYGSEIYDAIVAISKRPDVSYDNYINTVNKNRLAKIVKYVDTTCNLSESIRSNNQRLIQKYMRQLPKLTQGLEGLF